MGLFKIAKNISDSKWFDNFITIIILLAGIVVGLQTSDYLSTQYEKTLLFIDQTILFIFVIEILVKVLAEAKRPWRYFYDSWHIFDFVIVALCFLPMLYPNSNTEFFAVFRLARILRLAKIFEKIQNLKILLLSLVKSLPKMSYVLILLSLLFYIYGVIGTDIFGKYAVDDFGTIWSTMKSLFIITFEGWSWIQDITVKINGVDISVWENSGYQDWVFVLYFGSFLFMSAMIFLNLFIGIITSDMESAKAEERRGKAQIFKKSHTLILGWSLHVFKIIEELIEANDSKERAYIVILADRDKEEMDFEIEEHFRNTGTTKIICRTGSKSDLSNLKMVNAWNSRSIILLNEADKNETDLLILKSIIALINHTDEKADNDFHIIAEMQNSNMIKVAKSISNGKTIFFESQDFVARLIAQTSLQAHLSQVYTEIIGFDGSEFYINSVPEPLVGKSYKNILLAYDKCCPIGVINNNEVIINPVPDYKINQNDKLIVLSQDDSTIKLTNLNYHIKNDSIIQGFSRAVASQNILILGANSKLAKIVKEINDYLQIKSYITVITNLDSEIEYFDTVMNNFKSEIPNFYYKHSDNTFELSNLEIKFLSGDIEDYDTLFEVTENISHVTVLSYYDYLQDAEAADSVTLVSLIHLRNITKAKQRHFTITAEIINDNNRELINNPDVSDFIVSTNIISSILAQLSEEKKLEQVFSTLFNADGSEIYLRPANKYCTMGSSVNFATLVESAIDKNETAIGYVIAEQNTKFIINPNKNYSFTISEDDLLIVLAED